MKRKSKNHDDDHDDDHDEGNSQNDRQEMDRTSPDDSGQSGGGGSDTPLSSGHSLAKSGPQSIENMTQVSETAAVVQKENKRDRKK